MDFIRITKENIDKEHICCAIGNAKDCQVLSKKSWLNERFDEGLVFLRADARGKCFIEYIPAENAWVPIEANDYMHINCLWVSGQLSGHGYSGKLLDMCIEDCRAKNKKGISIISSPVKKLAFLSDPKYLAYKGFKVADNAEPYFTLMYLPLEKDAETPRFMEHVKKPRVDYAGYALYYTKGCPFTAKYVPIIEECARKNGVEFKSILIDDLQKAKNAPAAWTNFALFKDGSFITHEIPSPKKFEALIGAQ